jgi:hypothetical protein
MEVMFFGGMKTKSMKSSIDKVLKAAYLRRVNPADP